MITLHAITMFEGYIPVLQMNLQGSQLHEQLLWQQQILLLHSNTTPHCMKTNQQKSNRWQQQLKQALFQGHFLHLLRLQVISSRKEMEQRPGLV
jgi:hypothetical protein